MVKQPADDRRTLKNMFWDSSILRSTRVRFRLEQFCCVWLDDTWFECRPVENKDLMVPRFRVSIKERSSSDSILHNRDSYLATNTRSCCDLGSNNRGKWVFTITSWWNGNNEPRHGGNPVHQSHPVSFCLAMPPDDPVSFPVFWPSTTNLSSW